ncbi:MAG: DUF1579 domain-containing protein [Planctomycetota bacterium]
MKTIALLATLLVGAFPRQDVPEPPSPLEEHAWLHQLVGEWTVTATATMEPGAEPMRMESTERVRSIGGLWIVAEGSASLGGTPFTSILTLGYDPPKKAFVGTWIDSMQTHLWTHVGTLDESKRVLTLETEGPAFGDPTRTASYRDAIELTGPDQRVLTSSVQAADGTWTTFLRAEYRRQKAK